MDRTEQRARTTAPGSANTMRNGMDVILVRARLMMAIATASRSGRLG
jgi:hypothetical protein